MAKIIRKYGDIFTSTAEVLVNPVNTVGVMGRGLALGFKERYPGICENYKKQCKRETFIIGSLLVYRGMDGKRIMMFPTKREWRNKTHRAFLCAGLRKFLKHYKDLKITTIAFPLLGAGLGGLSREESLAIMHEWLEKLDDTVSVEIWEHKKEEG